MYIFELRAPVCPRSVNILFLFYVSFCEPLPPETFLALKHRYRRQSKYSFIIKCNKYEIYTKWCTFNYTHFKQLCTHNLRNIIRAFMKFIISLIYQTRCAENNVKYDIVLKTKKQFQSSTKAKKKKSTRLFLILRYIIIVRIIYFCHKNK